MTRRPAPGWAAALLPLLFLGACAAPDLRGRPLAAVLEASASAPRLASCLAEEYAGGPFRLEVDTVGTGIRITALGMPGSLAPWRRRPRFEIEVAEAGRGTAEVVLRTVPTLLGPEAEVDRLRRRVAACADAPSGAAFRSIAGARRAGLHVLPVALGRRHSIA
ncbi:hypothetical protein E2C06_13035 [Dankookia rubra]|uniref:Lipoprotein n=1 Tax=Dankookia rubra TaxID=1442381 RepID=A0A4R5QGP9_9PROT|nr:hypothetical protein [Dankookia rubra]TDH62103.1 hypothetical protein E2C06_13035 [Dankookia rubra]